jgi:hypothetical protein
MNPYQHSKLAAEIYAVIYNLTVRGTLTLTSQDDVENLASSIAIKLNEKSEIEPEICDIIHSLPRRSLRSMSQADEGNLAISIAIELNEKFGIELGEPPDRPS